MNKELFEQIEIANKHHPDLALLDLIEYVCNAKYPTRKYVPDYSDYNTKPKQRWKLTNYDLLQAFKQHNKLRQNDRQTTDS